MNAQPYATRVTYTIDLVDRPDPAMLPITIELEGTWGPQVRLGLMKGTSPDSGSTFDYYRIKDSLSITYGDSTAIKVPPLDPADNFAGTDQLVFCIPPGSANTEKISIKYLLDTTRNGYLSREELGRIYKDRILLKPHFATLRGDVLFFPLSGSPPGGQPRNQGREVMCNEEHAEQKRSDGEGRARKTVRYEFRIRIPDGWHFHSNAETEHNNGCAQWEQDIEAGLSVRWFAVAGSEDGVTCRDIRADEESVVRRLVAVKSEAEVASESSDAKASGDAPEVIFPVEGALGVAERFIADFDHTFGSDMLKHVRLPYEEGGAGTNDVYLFLVPFPAQVEFGAGGQYSRGTTYCFYTHHRPGPLAHTGAHEYFHVYNDGALWSEPFLNNWFAEGYTEVQATLSFLRLQVHDHARRENLYKMEMAHNWATMQIPHGFEVERRLRREGLLETDRPFPPPDPSIGQTPFDRFPRNSYGRLIRGRSFLMVHIIAMIFESGAPYRKGFDDWFKRLYRDFDACKEESRVPGYGDIRQAALENAGAARGELDAFLSVYIESNEELEYEDLVNWIRWAEEQNVFSTLFATCDEKSRAMPCQEPT